MKHIKILVTFILMMSMMLYCGAGVYALDDGGEPEPGVVIPAEWDIDNIDDFTRMLNYLNTDGERPCVANLKVDINFPYPVQAIGNDLTIKGNGHTISGVTHYIARDGRTITFGNTSGNKLTLKGSDRTSIGNDNMGLLASDKKGHFVMYSGVTVQDNFTSRGFGGAVTLIGGSSFHMYGGTIQNCGVVDSPAGVSNGGAIAILDESTFIMDGGIIENCSAEATATLSGGGGGAVFIGGSTFIMNGGTIRNCKASGAGGAILVAGSKDEYSTSSTIGSHLEINGGTITGNTARAGAGICAKSYNYESSEESMGRVPGENAGSASGILEIKNCSITDNKATGIGGGILLQDIKLADGKNIVVSGCTITGNGGYGLKFDDTTRVCLKGV